MAAFSVKSYFKGEDIFKEGSSGDKAYIVKEGKVEISKKIGNEKIILATLTQGDIFGEMALLNNLVRTASAHAIDYSEVVIIEREQYLALLNSAPKIISSIISSLIQKLKNTTSRIPVQLSDNPFLSVCHIIYLLGKSGPRASDPGSRSGYSSKGAEVVINNTELVKTIEEIISISSNELESILKKLTSVNLITIESSAHEGKTIKVFDVNKFLVSAQKVYDEFKDVLSASFVQERNLIHLDELSKIINVPSEAIYKRICMGDLPASLLYFGREEILKWIGDKGLEFLNKMRIEK
ncbi:MAG: cyclic nucleotide-binding domain-containing protein [Candidatus Tectomicrobia bacterium]|uniref:Cyclic nucleotide-binding domain-containing protein n=1 Tax=Tectimicrobiota bacterium TaxID=2528274 RepID=A0A933GPL9_UNCTE|nr:cyclic nucleotide-binding domain-containing protein [Candidatus Tectomicrobia bacterium]